MRYFLSFFAILFSISQSVSQDNCACCTAAHDQFDFWVGDWVVYNEGGDKVGENLVEKLEKNCLISENWKGESGGTGKSFNYYDPEDETWNQLWISSSGTILELKGKAKNGKMILKSELIKDKKGDYYNQITWTKNKDGSVEQLWEILDLQGNLLSVAFKGTYRKK